MDIAELQRKMRDAFRVEAADLLTELDSSMLDLESRPEDADLLARVFRAIHTIKGSGATAGFTEMAAFTHHVEELFDEARMGRLTITPEMIDLALRAKDLIAQLMEADGPGVLESECAEVVKSLTRFLPHKADPTPKGGGKTSSGISGQQRHKIFFKPHAEVFFSGTDPVNLVDEICTLGDARVTAKVDGIPPLDSLNPEQCYLAWQVELVSTQPVEKIKEIFLFVEDESEIRIESEPESAADEPGPTGPLATFLNIAGQSQEAISGFLTQLQAKPELDSELYRNYLRILATFQAAARHQQQQEIVGLLDEQVHLLNAASSGKVALSSEAKGRLANLHQKLTAVTSSLGSGNGRDIETPAAIHAPPNPAISMAAPPVAESSKKEPSKTSSTIRVDQDKLDRLMRAVGELLVARNAFPILAKKLAMEHGLSSMGKEVKDAGGHISHIAEDLQAAVMSIRMMPIRSVFQRFPRLVRDICRSQNKEAELILEGEDTELDKTVIEQIGDPLVHLVRNALDHGIEAPEAREQAGKPRSGIVRLRAYNKGTNVVIEIRDDGRGMDSKKIKQKAVEKGLLTAQEAAALSESAALELIFLPGLSTAEKVTDISGRGVGMDVVRSNIKKVHGTTTLESEMGRGSRVTITLPTSLMVSRGILVESKGEEYIFPIESVEEMVRLPRNQIHRHEQQHFANVRNEVFSVLRLADCFGSKDQSKPIEWPEEVPLAIIRTEQARIGVAVDRFVSDVEVIIKPVGRDLADPRAFRGATIMGDGRVVLVVNPAGLTN